MKYSYDRRASTQSLLVLVGELLNGVSLNTDPPTMAPDTTRGLIMLSNALEGDARRLAKKVKVYESMAKNIAKVTTGSSAYKVSDALMALREVLRKLHNDKVYLGLE